MIEIMNTSNHVDITNSHRPVGIFRGLAHPGDALHWLGTNMMDAGPDNRRRWIIDARDSRYPIALAELACFANQVTTHPEKFSNLAIAWVEESPMSGSLKSILNSLPVAFHEFESFDAALGWLHEES